MLMTGSGMKRSYMKPGAGETGIAKRRTGFQPFSIQEESETGETPVLRAIKSGQFSFDILSLPSELL